MRELHALFPSPRRATLPHPKAPRVYRTCTAPVARVGLAEPLTPLFSSARTELHPRSRAIPATSNMMAIRSGLPAGKRPSFPQQGGQVSQQGHPQSQGSGQSQGGGQGQQGHLHKGQGQGHGHQGQQKSKGAFEGPQRALTRSHRWATPTRGASPLAATHSAILNHIHLASLWNRLGKQSLFHVASYMSLCFMHVRGLSHREEVRQLLWRTVLLSWWTHVV
jgi:hypothetical protein